MTSILLQSAAGLADEYARSGVVQVPAVLSPAEVGHIKDVFTAQVEIDRSLGYDDGVGGDDILARFPRFVHPHRHLDTEAGRLARRWMLEPRLLGLVTRLIGPALGAQSMFYFKPPGARGQALHQDNMFLQAHPETCLAAWIAIDNCDGDNGGLRVVPGSHGYELICRDHYSEADHDESFTSAALEVPEDMQIVQTEMRAGDVLFFHGSTVHGSERNRTTDRFRRSLIFHYVPQASTEVSRFYNPLLTPDGQDIVVDPATGGGACGEGWLRIGEA